MARALAAMILASFSTPTWAFIERPDNTEIERRAEARATARAATANCDRQAARAAEALLELNHPSHLYSIAVKEIINLGTEKTDEGEWINNSTAQVAVTRLARNGRSRGPGGPRPAPNYFSVRVKMVYEPELGTCDVITISIEP